jgi:hypothetical protein
VTARVRACGGLDAAEAAPRRCVSWRSRGRRWRGPAARATERPCRLSAGRKRGEGSLGHCSYARHGRRPPRGASGWQRQRGQPCAAAWADQGVYDRAGGMACCNELSTRAGENRAPGRANCCRQWGFGILPAGEPWSRARRGKATEGMQAGEDAHLCGRVVRATVSRRRR